jgi:hypothetical protein
VVRGKGLFGMRVKFTRTGITFDGGVELPRVEGFKTSAKPRQLARRKLLDGLFNIFGSGHFKHIASAGVAEKRALRDVGRVGRYPA